MRYPNSLLPESSPVKAPPKSVGDNASNNTSAVSTGKPIFLVDGNRWKWMKVCWKPYWSHVAMDLHLVHFMNAGRHHPFSLVSFLWWKCRTGADPGTASCFFGPSIPIVMEFGFRVRGYTNHNIYIYILIIKMESCHNDIGIWLVQLHPAEFSWSLYSSHCLERFHEVTIGWWNAEQLESLGSFRSANGCVSLSQGTQYNWCQHSKCWNILKGRLRMTLWVST